MLNFRNMKQTHSDNTEYNNQRATPRRRRDQCVGEINGQNYPIKDWSMGGLRVFGNFKTSDIGQEVPIILKFKVQTQIVNIPHVAHIVRKVNDEIALQFAPLTRDVRRDFHKVIDNYNVLEFAGSVS